MKRLIFSACGVILTFIWIIYTAPPIQGKNNASENGQIKTINRSGSTSINKIRQPISKSFKPDTLYIRNKLLVNSALKAFVYQPDEKE